MMMLLALSSAGSSRTYDGAVLAVDMRKSGRTVIAGILAMGGMEVGVVSVFGEACFSIVYKFEG